MRKMSPALAGLINLHDRGLIVLPDNVIAARQRYRTALNLADPEMPTGGDLTGEIVASIHADEPIDIAEVAADLIRRREVANAAGRAIYEAREQLAEEVDNAILDTALTVLAESLRPAHDDIVAELKAGIDAEDGYEGDVLLAPADVREKLARRAELVERYNEISTAAHRLARVTQGEPKHDTAGYYSRLRNPNHFKSGTHSAPRIPTGIVEQIRAGGEPWLPSIAEQDDAFKSSNPRYAQRMAAHAEGVRFEVDRARRAELIAAGAVGPGMDRPNMDGGAW